MEISAMPNTAILSSSYQRVIDFSPPGTVHEDLGEETQHNLIWSQNWMSTRFRTYCCFILQEKQYIRWSRKHMKTYAAKQMLMNLLVSFKPRHLVL